MSLDKKFWETKYIEGKTGWDIGHVSTPLKEYVDQLTNKDIMILIPGAGNAYEAQYLLEQGLTNVHVVDIAEGAIKSFLKRVPSFPEQQIFLKDLFEHKGKYDLIIEQTFFCALDPTLRDKYVDKMFDLLDNGGKLVGLLFKFPLSDLGPPFGGKEEEYMKRFERKLKVLKMEEAYNSIAPRKGNELFFMATKLS